MVRKHVISFKHALDGVIHAFKTQPNFKVHIVLSLIVIYMGSLLNISLIEWIIIVMTITLGLVIELINTSIEAVVDLATDKWHHFAKIAKDVSAGAMLVYATGSVIIACLIFLPKII